MMQPDNVAVLIPRAALALAASQHVPPSQSRPSIISNGSITASPIPTSRWNPTKTRPSTRASTGNLAPP